MSNCQSVPSQFSVRFLLFSLSEGKVIQVVVIVVVTAVIAVGVVVVTGAVLVTVFAIAK